MNFKKNIKYNHGSYTGFLNGVLATSMMGTQEEVKEQLDYIESILNRYDENIINDLFRISKERTTQFLTNPDDLIHILDLKQDPNKRRDFFNNMKKNIGENVSFEMFFNYNQYFL